MSNRTELLRIFCCAAESESFREAARCLGISPQAVTRAIKELEGVFGEPLFHRNTRQVQISVYGQRLAEQARPALSGIDQLFDLRTQARDQALRGRVRITVTQSIGHRFLVPLLAPLVREHPEIELDLRLSDLRVDAVDEGIDIGIRIGLVRDRSYIARVIAPIGLQVVATPELLARCGLPDSPLALQSMPISAMVDRNNGRIWPWYFADGLQFVPSQPAFTSDDQEVECEAALAGLCISQLPDHLVAAHVACGRLVALLPEHAPPPVELFIYRPQRGPVPARVRRVYDLLVQHLAEGLGNP
ncbi:MULTISPECIES: LysR family transcriptional regulator [unclassified Pseudomonas]|uniref:LysR family transcriptional regulator n=1 Tax=unclassified Pseudomonas TaxID=196821 RepID=UPI0035C108F7